MCAQIATRTAESNAIFIGKVIDVWPDRESLARESAHLSLAQWKQVIVKRWHGVLTAEELRFIGSATATQKGVLEFRFGALQRVRFTVGELLAGPRLAEVYTNATSCGFRFSAGVTYLVNAWPAGGIRHETAACSRTAELDSQFATEDLKALRAWRSGSPLSPRIFGHIDVTALRPDTRLSLRDEHGHRQPSAAPDANGAFTFDGLGRKRYVLEIEDSRGKAAQQIDLQHFGCFEASPSYDDFWSIEGTPVALERSR